ncbi:MAG: 3-methyl-2-oxobutanoate dehydrogenase subunit VorB [Clostridia bacterium]
MAKQLIKGNEAIGEAAIRGGCRFFFGYPITPQTEIPEYLSKRMFEVGGCFIQSESEIAAINMVYGAAAAGARAMTSSSSPGISLKQEGISYIACAQLPCVIVNMQRSGPGLGGITPSQADYFQAVKGGGHGDYKMIVYAPSTVQEAVDMMYVAFDKADQYRMPVFILGDGMLGQIMEPVEFPPMKEMPDPETKDYATTGTHSGKDRRIVNSLHIEVEDNEAHNKMLQAIYKQVEDNEVQCEEFMCEDAEILLTAYGTVGRICKSTVKNLRNKGVKIGLIRPKTLFPFPTKIYQKYLDKGIIKRLITVELSSGQFVEDVRLSVNGRLPVEFYGRMGGAVMTPEEIVKFVEEVGK